MTCSAKQGFREPRFAPTLRAGGASVPIVNREISREPVSRAFSMFWPDFFDVLARTIDGVATMHI